MSEFVQFIKTRRKINLAMVIINIIVFIILEIKGDTQSAVFMVEHGAAYTPLILSGQYWRLFTSMFLHFGFEHIAYNMISLIFLGDILESEEGSVRYLVIYICGGICGNLLSTYMDMRNGSYAVSAGASGAIFAVIGAILLVALRNRQSFGRNNLRRLGLMIVLMIMQGVIDRGVDSYAHFGGLVSGFLLALLICNRHYKKNRAL